MTGPKEYDVSANVYKYKEARPCLCEACKERPATHFILVRVGDFSGVMDADVCEECVCKTDEVRS